MNARFAGVVVVGLGGIIARATFFPLRLCACKRPLCCKCWRVMAGTGGLKFRRISRVSELMLKLRLWFEGS